MKTIAERVAELIAVAPPVTAEQRRQSVPTLSRRRPIDTRPAARPGGSRRP